MSHLYHGYVSHNQMLFFVFNRSYGFDKDTLWQSMASWEVISLNWQIVELAMVIIQETRFVK